MGRVIGNPDEWWDVAGMRPLTLPSPPCAEERILLTCERVAVSLPFRPDSV